MVLEQLMKSKELDHTFSDGSRYVRNRDGRCYYPNINTPGCRNPCIGEDCVTWIDEHPELTPSSLIPNSIQVLFPQLFHGSADVQVHYTQAQRLAVLELFKEIESRIASEKERVDRAGLERQLQDKRRALVQHRIRVTVDGLHAEIGIDPARLGVVKCPHCHQPIQDPKHEFDRIKKVLEGLSIEPFRVEDMLFCKTCNSLFPFVLEIKGC